MGFFTLMAFPALFMIAVWILGVVFDSNDVKTGLTDVVMDALPLDAVTGRREISDLLDGLSRGAGGLGFASVLILLYSGSGALGAVRQAVETSQGGEVKGRRFPASKLFDVLITAVTMPVLLVLLGLVISSDLAKLFESEDSFKLLSQLSGGGIVAPIACLLLFSWLYWVQNPADRSLTSSLVGGATTTTLIALVWLGLKLWFGFSGGGAAIYGALAAFIGVLLFVHLACLAVVFGAHLAASFRSYRDDKPEVG